MGNSHSSKLNKLAKEIWDWCIGEGIWLTIAHIPGTENVQADCKSRTFEKSIEWCHNKAIFRKACVKLNFSPNIDLFASRINYQIKPFVSYHPDPEAFAINALLIS